jgi:hypothetical protein
VIFQLQNYNTEISVNELSFISNGEFDLFNFSNTNIVGAKSIQVSTPMSEDSLFCMIRASLRVRKVVIIRKMDIEGLKLSINQKLNHCVSSDIGLILDKSTRKILKNYINMPDLSSQEIFR